MVSLEIWFIAFINNCYIFPWIVGFEFINHINCDTDKFQRSYVSYRLSLSSEITCGPVWFIALLKSYRGVIKPSSGPQECYVTIATINLRQALYCLEPYAAEIYHEEEMVISC